MLVRHTRSEVATVVRTATGLDGVDTGDRLRASCRRMLETEEYDVSESHETQHHPAGRKDDPCDDGTRKRTKKTDVWWMSTLLEIFVKKGTESKYCHDWRKTEIVSRP